MKIYLFLFLSLISCTTKILELNTLVDYSYDIEFNLNEIGSADFIINGKKIRGECYCNMENDVLSVEIKNQSGFSHESINITIGDNNFYAIYNHVGDIKTDDFTAYPVKQTLRMSSSNFSDGNKIAGQLFFEGIIIVEYLEGIRKIKFPINGQFSCSIVEKKRISN